MRNKEYRSSRAGIKHNRRAARVATLIAEYPRESIGLLMGTFATGIIFVNALFLQHGPHPAPIFATHHILSRASHVPAKHSRAVETKASPAVAPAPQAAAHDRAQTVTEIQRELAKRGFYDGAVDGVWGAKTDSALRDFAQAVGLKGDIQANEDMLRRISASNVKAGKIVQDSARHDPIAKLLAPSKRVLAVQRALSDFGYGQIKPTGVFGPDTQSAIEKFERDRRLPITGKISDQLVRELAAVTGRPLE
ncbi:MAG TPA: peptidoglycan-binding domain-containing protein [Pseudolabrys sp.]|nr:peptidoglycan-binding domain-containing protein [Pseudolabrys sp.]